MKIRSLAVAIAASAAAASSALAGGVFNNGFGNNIAIPDASEVGATLTLNVPTDPIGGDVISSLSVGMSITHSWQGDILAVITSPAGTSMALVYQPGVNANSTYGFSADNFGDAANGMYMMFDDAGSSIYDSPALASGIANVTGTWQAYDGSLNAAFGGENAVGTWTLSVWDFAGGDTGTINGMSLSIGTVPAPGPVALLGVSGLLAARRRR